MSTPSTYIEQPRPTSISSVMTEKNQHEVRCGMCAREIYVDDLDYASYSEALLSGLDNPFRCEVCGEEYDDLAYEG